MSSTDQHSSALGGDTGVDGIGGGVEAGFEGVREAFAAATTRPGGAAFAAYLDGRPVVDLWLGQAAPGRPWRQDTPAVVMSATKGVAALAGHIAVDRGQLDLDAPVAEYWPEFGAAAKDRALVRHVLAHTVGVPAVPGYLDFMRPDGTGWDREDEILRRIAAAAPLWEPGTRATYHANTYGWMLGELIRRATGNRVEDVIRDDIATPLGIEFGLGVRAGDPAAARRAAVITPARATEQEPEKLAFERALASADTPLGRSVMGDGTTNLVFELDHFMNDGPGGTLPLASSNGIATARDLARVYQALARGGELDGVRLLSEQALRGATATEFDGVDEHWGLPARWALGFQLSGNLGTRFGQDGSGFGMPGQGGQYGWADPDRGLSFAYVRNHLDVEFDLAPMDALYRAIR